MSAIRARAPARQWADARESGETPAQTVAESLGICNERTSTLLIAPQLLEEGSGLKLIIGAKAQQPELRTLLFLQHSHRTRREEAVQTHSDGIVLEQEMGSGHVMVALRAVSQGSSYLEPSIAR